MADNPETGLGGFSIPDTLPILPLREAILLPFTATPLVVGQPRSVKPIGQAGSQFHSGCLKPRAELNVFCPAPARPGVAGIAR